MTIDLGIDTFGDTTQTPDGTLLPHDQVLRNTVHSRQPLCLPCTYRLDKALRQ